MKVLCLSDLHIKQQALIDAVDHERLDSFLAQVKACVGESSPDCVVITGDTVSPLQIRLLSALLKIIVGPDIPIVVTLGNHEFWSHTFEGALDKLRNQTLELSNVYYLDLIGGVELGGINFVGGALFFDGSMRFRDDQKITPWNGWNDHYIVDIEKRYLEFNKYYTDMIHAKMKPGMPTALCTHHLPHVNLNGHRPSPYSFYCGIKDFVHELPFDHLYDNYLICGHTHRRIIGEAVPNFMCVNVGSDYGNLQYHVLDV